MQSQKDAKEVRLYARSIHESNINGSFNEMLQIAKESNDDDLIAYVAGFLLHNCLDSCAHPYICYSTGSANKKTGHAHQLFEGQIDLGVLQANSIAYKDYRPKKLIKHSKKQREKVASLLQQVLQNVHGINATYKQVYDSLKDFVAIEKILDDVKGNKYSTIEKIENSVKKPGLGTSMMIPSVYDDKLDAMNYRHDRWYDPCNENNSYTTSFEDMFNQAVERGKEVLYYYQKYIFESGSKDDILKIIGNRSFTTGYPTDIEMYYFKIDQQSN